MIFLQARKDRTSVLGACDKDLKETVVGGITRWVLGAGLVFNAVTCPSFGEMIKLIGEYGVRLKPPTMYELRVPLFTKEVQNTLSKLRRTKTSGLVKVVHLCLMVGMIQWLRKTLSTS